MSNKEEEVSIGQGALEDVPASHRERIGMTMSDPASTAITVKEMLVHARYSLEEEHKNTKEEVYKGIVRYIRVEGHHWVDSTEANINVLGAIRPISVGIQEERGLNH